MEKVNQKEHDRRIAKMIKYVTKHGWLKVAMFCNYQDVAPCKLWVKRRRIPVYVWPRLEQLLEGKANVEIQINERNPAET